MKKFQMNMGFQISDEVLATFVPIFSYWIYSTTLAFIEYAIPKYKMKTPEEQDQKNLVPKSTVIKGVLLQQFLQALVAILVFFYLNAPNHSENIMPDQPSKIIMVVAVQFVTAMLVMDTWQYFIHRYMHHNKFLYKHIHSHHHLIGAPYAFGAFYNHPLEGLLVDTLGGAVSFFVSGMSPRTSIFFFSLATIKAVDDHSGLWIPWNPFHLFFKNNSAYHDIHHQLHGTKYNFSQPFFVSWDRMLGTYYMPRVDERKDKQI